jgi:hypothetical protein
MSEAAQDFEALLQEALRPVEPRDDFALRLEDALTNITALATEELESWELSAMRDPRNWVRPAAALMVGGAAATALVVLRARRQHEEPPPASRQAAVKDFAERTLGDFSAQVRRLVERRS